MPDVPGVLGFDPVRVEVALPEGLAVAFGVLPFLELSAIVGRAVREGTGVPGPGQPPAGGGMMSSGCS